MCLSRTDITRDKMHWLRREISEVQGLGGAQPSERLWSCWLWDLRFLYLSLEKTASAAWATDMSIFPLAVYHVISCLPLPKKRCNTELFTLKMSRFWREMDCDYCWILCIRSFTSFSPSPLSSNFPLQSLQSSKYGVSSDRGWMQRMPFSLCSSQLLCSAACFY